MSERQTLSELADPGPGSFLLEELVRCRHTCSVGGQRHAELGRRGFLHTWSLQTTSLQS